jgi:hypothetical protein
VLLGLVAQASVTCIEFPTSWGESQGQIERIRAGTLTRDHYCAKLDLTGNDVGDLRGSWPPRYDRQLHVLVPAGL